MKKIFHHLKIPYLLKQTFILLIINLFSANLAYAKNTPSNCYGTTKDGRLENGWLAVIRQKF